MKFQIPDYVIKKETGKTEALPLGEYSSVVTKVDWAEGYKMGSALKIEYLLANSDGETFEHSEIFYNKRIERTNEFFAYLYKNGIRDIFDFEGCRETVKIGYDISGRKRYTSIIERSFVGKESSDTA